MGFFCTARVSTTVPAQRFSNCVGRNHLGSLIHTREVWVGEYIYIYALFTGNSTVGAPQTML